jgi:sensor domain CHASE-containing protein
VQLFLVSLALPLLLAAVIYVLSSLVHKVEDWQAVKNSEPVVEKALTIEIDKSSVK